MIQECTTAAEYWPLWHRPKMKWHDRIILAAGRRKWNVKSIKHKIKPARGLNKKKGHDKTPKQQKVEKYCQETQDKLHSYWCKPLGCEVKQNT